MEQLYINLFKWISISIVMADLMQIWHQSKICAALINLRNAFTRDICHQDVTRRANPACVTKATEKLRKKTCFEHFYNVLLVSL